MNTFAATNSISPARFLQLCKRFLVLNQHNWLIAFGAVGAGLFILWTLPILLFGNSFPSHIITGQGVFLYFLGGLLLTSRLFHELYTPAGAHILMTLPAPTIEKMGSAWLISTIIYTFAALFGLFAMSALVKGISILASVDGFSVFNPLSETVMSAVGSYMGIHSLFFLGAIHFRKNNFLKTLLSLGVIFIILFTLGGLALYLLSLAGCTAIHPGNWPEMPVLRSLLWTGFTLGVLAISYFRLQNKQIA